VSIQGAHNHPRRPQHGLAYPPATSAAARITAKSPAIVAWLIVTKPPWHQRNGGGRHRVHHSIGKIGAARQAGERREEFLRRAHVAEFAPHHDAEVRTTGNV
jgi:hypothetical protein